MILAGDIGGTHTRLALFDAASAHDPHAVEIYPSREHASLEELVGTFTQQHGDVVELACFGIAGPVAGNRSVATNLPWVVDGASLAVRLKISNAWLINDLEASAYGIAVLQPNELAVLQTGNLDASGNAAIISAGTGLGEAGLSWDGKQHLPFATEGGHASFAADSDLDIELFKWLRAQFKHVSWERVLSGPGLENIYRFLKETGRGEEPAWLREEMQHGDGAAVIAQAGLNRRSELCATALDCFSRYYGAEAGNLALKIMARGGVYLGGGIAPKNLDKLADGSFLRAFVSKGRMQALLEAMPVRVILSEIVNLLGAARCAALRSQVAAAAPNR